MPIPDQILDEIQAKTDIVEIISAYVQLKKAGRNYKGLCPFHNEKTPSFVVNPDKQIYHCFGCGAGGNAFGFLMRHERMEFPEAVKLLAERAKVRMPSITDRDRAYGSVASQICEINNAASVFYQNHLARNQGAKEYLRSRGITEEAMKLFRLGLAPMGWDSLLNHLTGKGYSVELIEKAGLVIANNKGGHYDRFRERVIFPIFDLRGRILGFGGRVLDSGLPKYVNSPETLVYSKGKNLYGLNFSKDEVIKKRYVIMVEGYLDFMIPFLAGVKNVAATLGTALTQDQARVLKRFARTCVVVYDPDEAGEAASLRSLDIFINEGISVYVATLKKGYDPDSYIRTFGLEDFNAVIKKAKNLFDYKLELLSIRFNPKDIHGKVEIAAEMLPTISRIENAILRSGLVKKLAEALSVDEDSLKAELKKVKPDYRARLLAKEALPAATNRGSSIRSAEKMLLALMLEDRHFIKRTKDVLKAEELGSRTMVEIVRALFEYDPESKDFSASRLLNSFRDNEEATSIISEAGAMNDIISDKDRVFVDCVETIKRDKRKTELAGLQEAIKLAHASRDEKAVKELVEKYNRLVRPKPD